MKKYFAPIVATTALAMGCSGFESYEPSPTEQPVQIEPDSTDLGVEPHIASRMAVEAYFDDKPYIDISTLQVNQEDGYITDVKVSVDLDKLPEIDPEVSVKVQNSIVHIQGYEGSGLNSGSGFLMHDSDLSKTVVMTAAHVPDNMDPESILVTLSDGTPVDYEHASLFYNRPEIENNPDWEDEQEDLAYMELADQSLADRALQGRNLVNNPLRVGEILYAVNFQDEHLPGDPAVFGVMYAGEGLNSRFGNLIGDLYKDIEEDDLRGGGSGGVIVDANGDVVGMSIAIAPTSSEGYRLMACGQPAYNTSSSEINSQRVWTDFLLPENAECDLGYSWATMRQIGPGFFVPNELVELELISSDD